MAAKALVKTETAAEEYARLKEEQFERFLEASFSTVALKGVQLYEVKVPTGKVFKCRFPDVAFSQQASTTPMALSGQFLSVKDSPEELSEEERTKANQEKFAAMSPIEQRATIELTGKIVRYICVEPRIIVGEVNGHKNAISAGALSMADCGQLAKWAMSGGGAVSGLKTFRKKRR